ncbi:MAG: FeoB-associated Cys-rich membrane protein [Clostridiales bacterium]|nr:FeoB-associated Cys-rich membrane protein [Clostridiales bacterium]
MGPADWAVVAAVASGLAAAAFFLIRSRIRGRGCGCGCSGCSRAGSCWSSGPDGTRRGGKEKKKN